jgi:hypothetical protein
MDERRRHSGAPRWAVLAAAGMAGVLSWWMSTPPSPAPSAAPIRHTPAVSSGVAPVSRVIASRPTSPHPAVRVAGVVEVCGYGEVQLPPDDPDPVQRIPAPVRRAALDSLDTLMLASDDAQVRAAALWMGARLRGRDVAQRVEQVARLAAASQDPFIYAMALEACKGRVGPERGSCELLSPAQWVRLDPDNAVPWQALAAEAHAHDEPQAEDLALQFAARAARVDVHAGRLSGLMDKALGPQAAPLQRTLALSAGWSAEAVWSATHGVPVKHTAQGMDLSCEGVDRRLAALSPAATGGAATTSPRR